MSDTTASPARPVSLVTVIFLFALLGVFAWIAHRYYHPAAVAPQNEVAENLPKDLAWRATPATRRETLAALNAKHDQQATTYAWVDQKTGVIQLPIERAMELTAAQYGAKK